MKQFLLNSKNVERDSFVWNMVCSFLAAFQSVILLMVLTRTVDLVTAGIFTIANANANLFLYVGKFGVRNYQVSDVRHEYSFREYHISRVLTVLLMFSSSVIYTIYATISNGYTSEKAWVIIWMCIFKLPDAYEDVFYGEYQREGRLDVGAKCMTIRMVATIVLFAVLVVVTKKLLLSLIITTIFTVILMIYLLKVTSGVVKKQVNSGDMYIKQLIMSCLPVFTATFLAFYIGNAPKYAIDSQLSDELQAIYGFISMPVFVIALLNSFIFNPILFTLSCMWDEKQLQKFVKSIVKQSFIVVGITIVCIAGAFLLGIPVLSFVYNTDLTDYKAELLWLLVGGGLLGLSGVYTTILTIMRQQKGLMIAYILVSLAALLTSSAVVAKWSMMGAVMLYNALMLVLCFVLVIIIWLNVKRFEGCGKRCC